MIFLKENKKLIFLIIISICSLFVLMHKRITYSEIDSYALPIISLEYSGTIFMDESLLPIAQRDFPHLYKNINSFEDLRSSKMPQTKDGKWVPFYFPLYSALCLPIKVLLQIFKLNQEKCFFLCNISFVLLLFLTITYCKSLSFLQKVLTLFMLLCSPLFLYVTRIGMETMLFSLVGISMIFLYEKKYKCCAIITATAGLLNRTVMVIGIICIISFFIELFKQNRNNIIKTITKELAKIIKLALCFCVFFLGHLKGILTGSTVGYYDTSFETQEYWSRFLSYIFDINLGLCSFAPLLLLLGLLIIIINIKNKHFDVLYFAGCLFGTMAAYSFNYNINHSMTYCARYVFWSYPMLVLLVVIYGVAVFSIKTFMVFSSFSITLTTLLLAYNSSNYYNSVTFNNLTKKIFMTCPSLYNPAHSTFNCRVNHFHGGYSYRNNDGGYIFWKYELPIIYSDQGQIRKVLISKKETTSFLQSVYANETDTRWFKKQLDKLGDKEQYISISSKRVIKVVHDCPDNGQLIFYGDSYNANKYIQAGISGKEDKFSWTDGKEVFFVLRFPNFESGSKVSAVIDLHTVFTEKQWVELMVNGEYAFKKEVVHGEKISFDFTLPENKIADISISLPNACSPKSLGLSADSRTLGLAIKAIQFNKARM